MKTETDEALYREVTASLARLEHLPEEIRDEVDRGPRDAESCAAECSVQAMATMRSLMRRLGIPDLSEKCERHNLPFQQVLFVDIGEDDDADMTELEDAELFEIARSILQDLYKVPVVDIYGIKAESAYRIAAYGIEWDFDAIARDDDPPGKFAERVGNEVKAAVNKNPSAVAALREKLQDAVAAIDADTPTPSFEITVTGDYDSGMLTVTVSPKQV